MHYVGLITLQTPLKMYLKLETVQIKVFVIFFFMVLLYIYIYPDGWTLRVYQELKHTTYVSSTVIKTFFF